jgi:hypothetical protein
MLQTAIDRTLESYKKNVSELTNDNNLSYVNRFGETITFKVDGKGEPFYNHTDIHEEDEFYPTETKIFVVLGEDEKIIFQLYEVMAIIQQRFKSFN